MKISCHFPLLLLASLLLLGSCTKNIPAEASIFAGNNQETPLGARQNEPLQVRVTNNKGEPLEDVEVSFQIAIGNGTFDNGAFEARSKTNSYGVAQMYWTLGRENRSQKVRAEVDGLNGPALEFFGQPAYLEDSRDNQLYLLSEMGGQIWMGENLRYQANGSLVNPDFPATIYGRLYTWNTANSVCPAGFHLPSLSEWNNLVQSLPYDEGGPARLLKATSGWILSSDGIDALGFKVFAAGDYLTAQGEFRGLSEYGIFWSSEADGTQNAHYKILDYDDENMRGASYSQSNFAACRCVQD
ncbi:FISUMP domain-containing protein [Saprospira grandis]|uniref:FISUMP domain-containing protein n=1 Tax=Saprospira grandis TaxID=1008 RepID=UPI0022DDD7ED|nr:FISUMP domain-containing protein [Saprospira grandis]WBM75884.1 hypothetical protein OP864_06490 [Saprospira grandis]